MPSDEAEIESVVATFFAAFTSGPGCAERLDALAALFIPQAVVVRTCGGEPTVYDVAGFIAPRQGLLTGGGLTDFREWPVDGHVETFGDIAHWFGSYAKSGLQDGAPFTGRGKKSIQLIRTSAGWRISAAAWDDERDGLSVEAS